jgi:hypothetical protein
MSFPGSLKGLSVQDWGVALASATLMPLASLLLRRVGVARTRQALAGLPFAASSHRTQGGTRVREAQGIARIVHAVARRLVGRPKCLTRSIVLEAILKNRGIECDLKLGTRADAARFSAHAWVEHQGMALADPGDGDRSIRVLG